MVILLRADFLQRFLFIGKSLFRFVISFIHSFEVVVCCLIRWLHELYSKDALIEVEPFYYFDGLANLEFHLRLLLPNHGLRQDKKQVHNKCARDLNP